MTNSERRQLAELLHGYDSAIRAAKSAVLALSELSRLVQDRHSFTAEELADVGAIEQRLRTLELPKLEIAADVLSASHAIFGIERRGKATDQGNRAAQTAHTGTDGRLAPAGSSRRSSDD